MILVDLNQVLLSGLMAQLSNQKGMKLEEDLVRHMVLNTLRHNLKNFRSEYGDVVLCCDNRKYWRKEIFPFYKAGRKKAREKSDIDWHIIFDLLGKFKQELKENFPYKVIDVENAEADDIIGTLVPRYAMSENILILSSDGDFIQLQQYGFNSNFKVSQFNPTLKKFIISENPLMDLKEKIIRGDKGDGIPNIFSPSDCFVRELRQKSISKGKLEELMKENYDQWPDESAKAGYIRNQMLIDLKQIPSEIKNNIINTFDEAKPATKQKMLNYFIDKRLKNLMEVIEEF
jgi:5'-3' exonuclease